MFVELEGFTPIGPHEIENTIPPQNRQVLNREISFINRYKIAVNIANQG
jgi:hypothetical protein